MISKELQDIIQQEADKEFPLRKRTLEEWSNNWVPAIHKAKVEAFVAGATKYAELLEAFAEWCGGTYTFGEHYWYDESGEGIGTTSDLLTIFINRTQTE